MNDQFFYKKFLIAIALSIFFHLSFLYVFYKKKEENEIVKYTVVDLASFKNFTNEEIKQVIKKPPPVKRKIVEKKLKTVEIKKPAESTDKKLLPKQKKVIAGIEKIQKVKTEVNEKIIEEAKTNVNEAKKQKDTITKSIDFKKSQLKKDNELLVNQSMALYLRKISNEINKIANNVYPKKAIRRKLQGKIITRIKIGKDGEVVDIKPVTNKPKILVEATKKLLEKMGRLSTPPQILFQKNRTITLEIPVNYLLK
tara:strand:- start:75 stop:836 length:762 start_codon:yes stop_codon:yes gene_type:complete